MDRISFISLRFVYHITYQSSEWLHGNVKRNVHEKQHHRSKKTAGNNCAKCSEFGMKNIANAETIAPPKINGILRPNLVQVLSLERPTIGCTKVLQEELLTKNNLNDVHLHRLPKEFYWYLRSEENNQFALPKTKTYVPDLPERQEWFFLCITHIL